MLNEQKRKVNKTYKIILKKVDGAVRLRLLPMLTLNKFEINN